MNEKIMNSNFEIWNILRLVGDLSTWSNISRWEVYGAGDLLKVNKENFFLPKELKTFVLDNLNLDC